MPTQAQLTERYIAFMEAFNASLPAETSDEERKRLIDLALDAQIERDLTEITEETEAELEKITAEIDVEAGKASEEEINNKLKAVRQTLG